MHFRRLYEELRSRRELRSSDLPDDFVIWGIDPGETTGIAAFRGQSLWKFGQIKALKPEEAALKIKKYLYETPDCPSPDLIVMEDYRPYAHKIREHIGSDLFTSRLIGGVQLLAREAGTRLTMQSAAVGKGFCKNDKLRRWGFYQTGKPHANDAIRHICHYILFSKRPAWSTPQ